MRAKPQVRQVEVGGREQRVGDGEGKESRLDGSKIAPGVGRP